VSISSEFMTVTVRRRTLAIASAWVACLAMVAAATSVVGLFVAPLAFAASARVIFRRRTSWAVRVPVIIGTAALVVLFLVWVVTGAGSGSTTSSGSSA
jgi:hypothetical protein